MTRHCRARRIVHAARLALAVPWLWGLCAVAHARYTEVTIGGETKQLFTAPHAPYMSVGTLEQLREHFDTVQPFLPQMPFVMEGQWIIPGRDGGFRTFPYSDAPDVVEWFSSNGDYVAQVTRRPRVSLEFSAADSEHIRVMTTDGDLMWEMSDGPYDVHVLDDGRVMGFTKSRNRRNASMTLHGRDGSQEVHVEEVFDADVTRNPYANLHLQFISDPPLLLVKRLSEQIVAISLDGRILWRFTLPYDRTTGHRHMLGDTGLDPLGRGVYVQTARVGGGTSVEMLDPATGEARQPLWRHEARRLPRFLSPQGKYAGTTDREGIGIVDWATGEQLFLRRYMDDGTVLIATQGSASSVSDDPPRLVVPLSRGLGVSVFDASGERIWWCHINVGGYSKNYLSSDGRTLGVARTTSRWPITLYGVLLFELPEE